MLETLSKNDKLWKSYALSLCGCKDKANDLVQEMYLKIYNLNKTHITKGYVYRTLKSILINSIKERVKTNYIEDQFEQVESVEETIDLERRLEALNLLSNVTFFEKEVLLITHEKSLREAEKEIDVPFYVLQYHKKKALKKLKAYGRRTG